MATCLEIYSAGVQQVAEKLLILIENREKHASGAQALPILLAFVPGINPRPTVRMSFSTVTKPLVFRATFGPTEQIGEKVEYCGSVFETIPRWLKPDDDSIAFAARLKSCPFKTSATEGYFIKR
jgi:hypothetical protein